MMVHSPTKNSKARSPVKKGNTSNKGSFRNLKLQKGSKPFNGLKIFLDLRNLNASSKLETSIKNLGGVVNPFIDEDINLVVTDRAEWGGAAGGSPLGTPRPAPSPLPYPQLFSPLASPAGHSRGSNVSPATLDSPGESGGVARRYPKSRAEAMLERVRPQPQLKVRDPLADAQTWGITIFSLDKILKLIQKVTQSDVRSATGSQFVPKQAENKCRFRTGKYFLKIESTDRKFRPSYKDLPCWPTICLNSEPGTSPFRLSPLPSENTHLGGGNSSRQQPFAATCSTRNSPNKKIKKQSPQKTKRNTPFVPKKTQPNPKLVEDRLNPVTPRPPSKRHPERSQVLPHRKDLENRPKLECQPGYCEICKVDYADLSSHVETESHRSFATNEDNYATLDELINLTKKHVEAAHDSVCCEQSRSSGREECEEVTVTCQSSPSVAEDHVNMRQPVDERPNPSKMVGRKDALEVQCNGLSNHVQTRFTCIKGDRENLGNIFLDDRISSAQLRKRRAISVSCKDLLELGPSGERTHFLRSARAARSELSQLSPALSDNSHPLLNGNTQQPLLSPTLSERSHSLRTRSQIWLSSNFIEEESLLVTANNQLEKTRSDKLSEKLDKNDKSDKVDKGEKMEKSKLIVCEEASMKKDTDKELKETGERDVKSPRIHCRNRSIRRKRLSAEEKLIEDNRGYYKVEVLNSKLRSTGQFVHHGLNQTEETPNGRTTPVRLGSQGEVKEPVVVRFKKVRRSELSVLSDEAENFMFGEQTRSETNSDDSSNYETDDGEDELMEDNGQSEEGINQNDDSGEKDHNCNEDCSIHSRSRSNLRKVHRSNSSSCSNQDRPRRLKIKVGASSRCNSSVLSANNGDSIESKIHRKHRKRRTQAEAFITDNMDYYKFETPETRLRIHGFPNSPGETDDDMQDTHTSTNSNGAISIDVDKVVDASPCPVDKLHFSFESVPSSEVWYQTFQRQDRGEELTFPLVGEPSSVVLPYQIPKGDVTFGQRPPSRRRTKSSVRLPRKSPRCHASTLAILSSLVRRRNSREPEKVPCSEESPSGQLNPELETKNILCKKVCAGSSVCEEVLAKDESLQDGGDILDIARNIDTILGIPSWNDNDKDSEAGELKSLGKGRGRKKHSPKSTLVGNEVAGTSGISCVDRDKDPSLKYLVDPAILEELSCTCDVVSNPYGGPTMDIVTLFNTYSDCCCVGDDITADHGVDASCNSSECGTSSTCEMRMRKKRKRRNMTGWDKPKRRGILRRDVGEVSAPEDVEVTKTDVQKGNTESLQVQDYDGCEAGIPKISNNFASHLSVKCGKRRKLRSSLVDCSKKVNSPNRKRFRLVRKDRETDVTVSVKRGKLKKVQRMGWTKVR